RGRAGVQYSFDLDRKCKPVECVHYTKEVELFLQHISDLIHDGALKFNPRYSVTMNLSITMPR
ncbi:MAG TPA: hypothetical protein PLK04_06535, partial [Bacillota bacterium]|nr:hypothetical protein [Bacillota bacterium]